MQEPFSAHTVGTSNSWGDSDWTQKENFSPLERSAIGIMSPGKRWIPQQRMLFKIQQDRVLGHLA